jgi:predicted DNA-binding protein
VIAGRNHTEEVRMNTSGKPTEAKGYKTLAIRLDDGLHAQLSAIAQLRGNPIVDEIRQAIDAHIERVSSTPELNAHAEAVLEEIEREADAKRAAITALFGQQASSKTTGRKARGSEAPPAD